MTSINNYSSLKFGEVYLLSDKMGKRISEEIDHTRTLTEDASEEERKGATKDRFERLQAFLLQQDDLKSDAGLLQGDFTIYPKAFGITPKLLVTGSQDETLVRTILTGLRISFKKGNQEEALTRLLVTLNTGFNAIGRSMREIGE